MAKLSINKAAKEWGISRTTLQRAIKSGKLTSVQVSATRKEVDTAELLRVFGEPKVLQNDASGQVDLGKSGQVDVQVENAQLKTEIEYLKRENDLLREQLKKAQEMIPLMIAHQPKRWWQWKKS